MTETSVLIVGAGPVGLALALDLGLRGIDCLVVEQDERTGGVLLAKAGGLNERSFEFIRRWGIFKEVTSWGGPEDFPRKSVACTSLSGYTVLVDESMRGPTQLSPERQRKCPQYLFDPILADAVSRTRTASIRYQSQFETLRQDDEGVSVELTDVASGKRFTVRAQYMVGCDGGTSKVRDALGLGFEGKTLDYSISVMLRIKELHRYHEKGEAERFMFVGEKGIWANLTFVDFIDIWRFGLVGMRQRPDMTQLDMEAEIRRAFGNAPVPFDVLRVVPWRRTERTADRFRVGRVLLAGDAAHTTSPTGGLGLNTGLGDAFGLGWMLEAMLRGWGGTKLLDAHEVERRPVAMQNSSTSTKNYQGWVDGSGHEHVTDDGPQGDAVRQRVGAQQRLRLHDEWNSLGLVLGYAYEGSPIVVPDGTPPPPMSVSKYIPASRPGHRAPHAWLPDGRSLIDLFGNGFVLLRLGAHMAEVEALRTAAASRRVPLQVVDLDQAEIFGLYERRALVLVRPDGHVAWRGNALPADSGELIDTIRGAS